ncbi:non-ribosomal peptide synthase/amino acid adenylation enzyme [Mycobacteroides abscessus subsp. abscessus]|uniref:non-ribosomal peptide synthetase n=1 Tax=Mycobacteroides abscessus TaxID=36809 RepID=UPI0005DE26B8|nr:non-ribosomal peptide synthetase [Mycobacteroides abscessus]CPV55592.1 non-ribosomal peptide synthase/amino acid adenylation enzyme [Mycobacteroides abscessus]SHQ64264.1 non-ribosomal peptide synthase/amino acid adenylation enzyme [Mycobacteroides abscessus subsp. abscessus]SHR33142.1 non-ribosomal peptide synthase/amino acid adenylation enzyme [Mycobacteroides abscessus subsp. abscessus]SHZ30485.1 non-ribosomal peptide synthase/amino acid adenylation enzyme [Mycobacteroides abscessus subsp.
MTITGFLADLAEREVVVSAAGDQLRCSAPAGHLTEELLAAITCRKSEILAHLRKANRISRHTGAPVLSLAQERFWLLHQLDPQDSTYNLPLAIRCRGPLSVPALRQAMGLIMRRHEILRTRYALGERGPVPAVLAAGAAPALTLVDLTGRGAQECIQALAAQEARRAFTLATDAPLRMLVLRRAAHDHTLLLTRHHIASDGWSLGILLTELSALYEAVIAGKHNCLPELDIQYSDYAAWQRAGAGSVDLTPWHRLADTPATVELLGPRSGHQMPVPAGVQRATLPAHVVQAVRRFAGDQRVTAFTVVLAVYAHVLGSLSGQQKLVIGCPAAGRERPELEGLIGCFVDMLPLCLDLASGHSFAELVRHTHWVVTDGLAGQHVPMERLIAEFRTDRAGGTENPLFEAAFAFQNTPATPVQLAAVDVTVEQSPSVAPKFPLLLTVTECDGLLDGELEYDTRRVPAALPQEILRRVCTGLQAGTTIPGITVAGLERALAAPTEPRVVPAVAQTQTLTEVFARVVQESPDAIAVSCAGQQVSYRALYERAARLAGALHAAGVRADQPVGLQLNAGIELVAGMLGILLAGGAYVPLDPADPVARRQMVAAEVGLQVLVTHSAQQSDLGLRRIDVDRPAAAPAVQAHVEPGNLAYIVHTSGSTGRPKGVGVTHGNVTGVLAGCAQALPLTGGPRIWALTHSVAFDFSVWEIWGALHSGGKIVIAGPDTVRDPQALAHLLRTQQVHVCGQTPSALRHLLPALTADPGALTLLVLGGEACDPAALQPWFAELDAAGVELVNMYGITETTIHVTARPLTASDIHGVARSPIGLALPGQRLDTVDRQGNPLPVGGLGELAVSGRGVTRGYLGRPADTAERFRPDRHGRGDRTYFSGDLARVLPDGDLDYAGRRDRQVKVRGYRIETGDVEAAVRTHPSVRDCAVVLRTDGERTRLVAYVVPESTAAGGVLLSWGPLRAHLRERLPFYMLPAAGVFVDQLPLTRNGKRDDAALPAPSASDPATLPPRTHTEIRITEILASLLGRSSAAEIGAYDNFFDLGGDSLLLIQFHARVVEAFAIDLSLRQLRQSLNVDTLASTVDECVAQREADIIRQVLSEVEALADSPSRGPQ